jgi:hypothetical protein
MRDEFNSEKDEFATAVLKSLKLFLETVIPPF